jgi:TolB protein
MLRRILWIVIPVLLFVVLAGGGLLTWLLLQRRDAPIRLVVMGPDMKVRLLDDDGEQVLASDANVVGFGFPTPSPDSRKLAYVAEDTNGTAIVKLDLETGQRTELYRSREHAPLNLSWSPDGTYLAFLLNGGRTVHIVASDGSQPAQLIASGPPSYYAWSPDSTTLLLHLGGHSIQGGHVATYRTGGDQASTLLGDPGLFQAPAWALDGKSFFYVAQPPIPGQSPANYQIKSDIVRVTTEGKDPVMLVSEEQADLRMVRAPNSDKIAYMVRSPLGYGALKLVDTGGGQARVLSRGGEQVTAFFWSPDGTRIAYLTHEGVFLPGGERTWHIVDLDSGTVRDFETFQPSEAFAGLQSFFDAYLFSFSPWAPDGSRIAYGAKDGVYVLDTAAGRSSKMSDGALGMWIGGE